MGAGTVGSVFVGCVGLFGLLLAFVIGRAFVTAFAVSSNAYFHRTYGEVVRVTGPLLARGPTGRIRGVYYETVVQLTTRTGSRVVFRELVPAARSRPVGSTVTVTYDVSYPTKARIIDPPEPAPEPARAAAPTPAPEILTGRRWLPLAPRPEPRG